MRINVTGRPKHVSSKIAKEAVKFFASALMTSRLTKTLTINIRFVKDLSTSELGRRFGLDNTEWAVMDYDYNRQRTRYPKHFDIEINSEIRTEQKLLECLAHEMVHVKQYAKGELDYTKWTDKKRWMGKLFNIKRHNYWFWPWEVEAYGKEIGLVSVFLEHNAERLNLPLSQYGRPTKGDWKAS